MYLHVSYINILHVLQLLAYANMLIADMYIPKSFLKFFSLANAYAHHRITKSGIPCMLIIEKDPKIYG